MQNNISNPTIPIRLPQYYFPANIRWWTNVGLMLAKRRRRQTNLHHDGSNYWAQIQFGYFGITILLQQNMQYASLGHVW